MKFWKWTNLAGEKPHRMLSLDGPISEETWWGDEVTPGEFRADLDSGEGDITVRINSPGGDVFAAYQIYNMLREYDKGKVTVHIDALAASAASIVAMAGSEVLISPVGMIMIHNPATIAVGTASDMQKAAETLDEIKESIINAYESKTGVQRAKLSRLMDEETWMNSRKAIELGFADGVIPRGDSEPESDDAEDAVTDVVAIQPVLFSNRIATLNVVNKIQGVPQIEVQDVADTVEDATEDSQEEQLSAKDALDLLNQMKAKF